MRPWDGTVYPRGRVYRRRIGSSCARCNKCVALAHIEKYQKNLIYFSETP